VHAAVPGKVAFSVPEFEVVRKMIVVWMDSLYINYHGGTHRVHRLCILSCDYDDYDDCFFVYLGQRPQLRSITG